MTTNEPIDLGDEPAYSCSQGRLDIWAGPDTGQPVSRSLIEAFSRGEVTEGGLAEAGWFRVGKIKDSDDGVRFGGTA